MPCARRSTTGRGDRSVSGSFRGVLPRMRTMARKQMVDGLLARWCAVAGWILLPAVGLAQPAPVPAPVVTQPPAPTVTQPTAPVVTAPGAPVVTAPGAPVVTAPAAVGGVPVATPAVTAPPAPTGMIAIRDIDREMSVLSGDITNSHSRLQQITAMVLEQTGGGAQLIIEHQNDMGSTFRLMRASYALDGATIAVRTDDNGSLADQ